MKTVNASKRHLTDRRIEISPWAPESGKQSKATKRFSLRKYGAIINVFRLIVYTCPSWELIRCCPYLLKVSMFCNVQNLVLVIYSLFFPIFLRAWYILMLSFEDFIIYRTLFIYLDLYFFVESQAILHITL